MRGGLRRALAVPSRLYAWAVEKRDEVRTELKSFQEER